MVTVRQGPIAQPRAAAAGESLAKIVAKTGRVAKSQTAVGRRGPGLASRGTAELAAGGLVVRDVDDGAGVGLGTGRSGPVDPSGGTAATPTWAAVVSLCGSDGDGAGGGVGITSLRAGVVSPGTEATATGGLVATEVGAAWVGDGSATGWVAVGEGAGLVTVPIVGLVGTAVGGAVAVAVAAPVAPRAEVGDGD